MIGTVVRVGLLRMWHGRTEILLTFVVPIAFFTIFAFIFDEQIGLGKSPRVNLAIVDEDSTELSREFVSALAEWETLHIYAPVDHEDGLFVFSSAAPARELVLAGTLPAGGGHPGGLVGIAHGPRHRSAWISNCWPTPRTRWPPRWSPPCCGRPRAGSSPNGRGSRSRSFFPCRRMSSPTLRSRDSREPGGHRGGRSLRRRQGQPRGVHVRRRDRGDVPALRCGGQLRHAARRGGKPDPRSTHVLRTQHDPASGGQVAAHDPCRDRPGDHHVRLGPARLRRGPPRPPPRLRGDDRGHRRGREQFRPHPGRPVPESRPAQRRRRHPDPLHVRPRAAAWSPAMS